MFAPLAALLALAACSARTDDFRNEDDVAVKVFIHNARLVKGSPDLPPPGCLYEGRWYVEGATVRAREPCLRCACGAGALTCARRACAPLPDPPPARCHVLHRRDSCCPELHCPDGVRTMEHGASARLELDDFSDGSLFSTPSTGHACVEGGVVFAAGSALAPRVACETCFCLGGSRRCVRPRCLHAPEGCRARPAPGACCPQRFYCDAPSAPHPSYSHHRHDCEVDSTTIAEGERVLSAEANCTQCFCLRGGVRCQRLACAPPLLGCTPLLRDGQCCPHQYHCDKDSLPTYLPIVSGNSLTSTRYDDRSFHAAKSSRHESTTTSAAPKASTERNILTMYANKNQTAATSKVKRKTSDPPPVSFHRKQAQNVAKTTSPVMKMIQHPITPIAAKLDEPTTKAKQQEDERTSVSQPEGSMRIIINGTINCTAELTSSPTNSTAMNYTERIQLEAQPRVPFLSGIMDAATSDPNDIITDSNVPSSFDDNDTFTINVTSSLSHTTSPATQTTVGQVLSPVLDDALNISAKTKEDYDYDYTVPTLPPSLPNLKIIPFVAADAVVEDESSKHTYPSLQREDKFPVYYPTVESKNTPIATRREDTYLPTQYPVYVDKDDSGKYPSLADEIYLTNVGHTGLNNLASILHKYTVSTSLGTRGSEQKKVTKPPAKTTSFKVEAPAVNLFSPPAETEGGFIPKGPGIIDEYYAVYPSTPPGPPLPHLTTSMQIDVAKGGECVSSDGRHVPESDSISVACSMCTCNWGELHCVPRPCLTPPGCHRRLASSSAGDLCCGELVCDKDNKTTSAPLPTRNTEVTWNDSKVPSEIKSQIVLFDPPPDRAVPEKTSTDRAAVIESLSHENSITKDVNKTTNVSIQTTTTVANLLNKTNNDTKKNKDVITTTKSVLANRIEEVSTTRDTTTTVTSTSTVPFHKEVNETHSQSQEYEDEEEDDDFSFGSVLKLLLSDSYDATTPAPKRKLTTPVAKSSSKTTSTTTTPMPSTRRLPQKPTVAPFIPMPHRSYLPSNKVQPQNSVNRIDHLVLGEATAIKKSTPRPVTTSFRPMTTFKHFARTTTQRLATTTRMEVTKKDEVSTQYTSVAHEGSRSPMPSGGALPGVGGLLKLAGCNIYGRMYRVGRIIAELSTPCQECRCTEVGVQCHALSC